MENFMETRKTDLPWKSSVLKMSLYEAGKPITEVRREFGLRWVIKMASNENPLGPSHKVKEIMRAGLPEMHFYPDANCYEIRQKLSKKLGIPANMIVVGSGSAEVMKWPYEALLVPGDEVLLADICFPLYSLLAHLYQAIPVAVPLDDNLDYDLTRMLSAITEKTKIILLASPNNPTGHLIEYVQLAQFLAQVPKNILVILDLAYIEYSMQHYGFNGLELLQQNENLVLLRTFSKIYGLAGLRIGYGIAMPNVIDIFNRIRVPFTVNALAQAAAIAALDDVDHLNFSFEVNQQGKSYLYWALNKIGLRYSSTDANFILIDCKESGDRVFHALLKKGIIIRPMRHPRLINCIRVTIGTMEQNKLFIEKLVEVLKPSNDVIGGSTNEICLR